jgi:NAD(P)-dependent dehydrogenase (short-subunit alcohol dehydrogenase family)
MRRLEEMVAVVTGGARGIGAGCAERLAAEGAKVVIGDVRSDDSTAKTIEEAGGEVLQLRLDVRDRENWKKLVGETTSRFGQIDLLVNNAGIVNMHSPDDVVNMVDDGWDSVIDTHLRGTWLGMQACIPEMKKVGGGSIVNMSSLAAVQGNPNLASYSAAKGGILALTRQVAYDFGDDAIRVNAICPGTIRTPLLDDVTPEMVRHFESKHIIKRLGTSADVAAMVAFLLSEDASFVTGQSINCDGGWSVN